MGIKARFTPQEIRDALQREVRKQERRIVSMLNYVGQTVVNEIRAGQISNWIDHTKNLRSSIGYVVCLDGVPQNMSAFEQMPAAEIGNGETQSGSVEGRQFIQSLVPLFPKGIALIVVAGMEYASYVEKLENKTVLAQGEIEAKKMVDKMIQELNEKLESKL